jgi:hypothetical protein
MHERDQKLSKTFPLENLKRRYLLKNLGLGQEDTIKMDLKENGFFWLRTGTSGGLFYTR